MASNPPRQEPASHAEMSSDLHTHLCYWQAPKQVETLEQLFLHQSQPNATITRCVCIGVGAFQRGRVWPARFSSNPANYNESIVKSPMNQLAFLAVLLKLLGKRHAIQEVYVQDPLYNDMETSFLQTHLGYTVLDTPRAFDKVTPSTFLFAPRVHGVDVAEALERALPALYVGNDVDGHMAMLREEGPGVRWGVEAGTESGVPMLDTFEQFRERVDGRPMGGFEEWREWCGVTFIYWRRLQGEEVLEETGLEV
ncbi:MAG: hypothetical protein ASARMPRED_005412 [Alectoria sarmentosa]|nr:MAG: hypothetical protein ASARMPRED_005412 [Alectoria sarmentosa]